MSKGMAKAHYVVAEFMYQNGRGPVGFRLTLCGKQVPLSKIIHEGEKELCNTCEATEAKAKVLTDKARELVGTNHGKWIKGQPAFVEFPPGSLVACGGNTGVVVNQARPTDAEFGNFTLLHDSWHMRVPVKWDKTGNVTWCRVDDKILRLVTPIAL